MNADNRASSDPYMLAMQMEKVGQDFYDQLAVSAQTPELRGVFARLAKAEAAHYARFKELLAAAMSTSDRAADEHTVVTAMRTHVLPTPEAVSRIALFGDTAKALEMALRMEQDSVLFYRDLASNYPAHAGDLAKIIQEEQAHARLLRSLLTAVPTNADGGKP